MPTPFEIIFSEFSAELDALAEMAGGQSSLASSALSGRARIAAGNGATLLLAAIFEEFVRQQVSTAFLEKAKAAGDISKFPKKIASTVWKRSLEALARTPFEDIEANGSQADARLRATLAFCVQKDVTADVSEALAKNDHNMRVGELRRLFNQIGLAGLVLAACEESDLLGFLGAANAEIGQRLVEARIESFFRDRNNIAHAIKLGNSSGPAQLTQDIEFFRIFGKAICSTVERLVYPAGPEATAA